MSYDPCVRGAHPVGVRSVEWKDASRDRLLPVEVWYPAADVPAGRDLDPEHQDRYQVMPAAPAVGQAAIRDVEPRAGRKPVILFSHGFGGHRRQTTHLCTHLASRGFLVAAPDHVGNTITDMMQLAMQAQSGGQAPDGAALMGSFASDRPADMRFVLDRLVDELEADAERVGISGHSFGGWTSLRTAELEPRIRACVPLAPAGGDGPALPGENPLGALLTGQRPGEVPTLFLVADRDTLLPLPGMRELVARTPEPRRGQVLHDADHMHFCDRVEETHEMFRATAGLISGGLEGGPDFGSLASSIPPIAELCSGEQAETWLRGATTAHFEAVLLDDGDARAFADAEPVATWEKRGVAIEPLA